MPETKYTVVMRREPGGYYSAEAYASVLDEAPGMIWSGDAMELRELAAKLGSVSGQPPTPYRRIYRVLARVGSFGIATRFTGQELLRIGFVMPA